VHAYTDIEKCPETLGSGFGELPGPFAAGGGLLDELAEACPELPTALDGLDLLGDEALLTVSFAAEAGVIAITYALSGLTPGAAVTVTMTSPEVDTYLYLIDAAESPPFADLLHLTEIFPQALAIIAEHLNTSDSYSHLDGDTLYSRALIHVAW